MNKQAWCIHHITNVSIGHQTLPNMPEGNLNVFVTVGCIITVHVHIHHKSPSVYLTPVACRQHLCHSFTPLISLGNCCVHLMLKMSVLCWSLAVRLSMKENNFNISLYCWTVGGFTFLHNTVIISLRLLSNNPSKYVWFLGSISSGISPTIKTAGSRHRSTPTICLIST